MGRDVHVSRICKRLGMRRTWLGGVGRDTQQRPLFMQSVQGGGSRLIGRARYYNADCTSHRSCQYARYPPTTVKGTK